MNERVLRPPPSAPGNRQRQRTHTALLAAGQRLFAERPVEGVTIDDIVDAAEVGKGSFYNHFPDKSAFAKAIFELVQGDVEFHIYSANQEIADPPSRIARALCVVMRYALDHPDRVQTMLNLAERHTDPEAPLNAGVSDDVRRGMDLGRLGAIGIEAGVLVVLGLTMVSVQHIMSGEASGSARDLAAAMAAAALRALGLDVAEAAAIGRDAADGVLGGR
ncbi:TetR/AcrR family transcriptional regulator [Phenylobacterium montanum]|uniref:TetR/AcrR family transcriptional regulator n=1 Tax=Phenylobacterium montanum TaxID=2823693 RepID=A0A975G3M2_9CAUL|nr:TetR/AcrR family transcriptional regulator [Caulobacter sp. S6]QUD90265.1 TetR/AcrR family transcriptional regulator [Caulobacter sp. S6]